MLRYVMIAALVAVLVFTAAAVYAADGTITLVAGEGRCSGVADGKAHTYQITNDIEKGKIVVVSLDWGKQLENASKITMKSDETGKTPEAHGGWFAGSRMTYFVISESKAKYTVTVTPDRNAAYDVVVATVDKIGPFTNSDAAGRHSLSTSYYISNVPEEIRGDNHCLAKDGYYMCRATVQGDASIYWEHVNQYKAMKFGALLWNKESRPVKVTVNSGSALSYTTAGNSMEEAMCNVWLPWFDYFKKQNSGAQKNAYSAELSKKRFGKTSLRATEPGAIELPAYDAANPGASAAWLLVDDIPKVGGAVENTFNGLANVTIAEKGGALYTGSKVYCDCYALDDAATMDYVISNIGNMVPAKKASAGDLLRGSGVSATLETKIAKVNVDADNRLAFLLGGYDMPNIQKGEKVALTWIDGNGRPVASDSTYGFCNVYKITLSGINSSLPVKARIIDSKSTNPNAAWDQWAGLYVVGYCDDGSRNVFKKLVFSGQSFVFDENVPKNRAVTYYLVVSGMSSFPLEVDFYCDAPGAAKTGSGRKSVGRISLSR